MHVQSGHTKSCGCFRRQVTSERSIIHGMHGTPEYFAHNAILQRCFNKKLKQYKDYGGRGVTVAPEWVGKGGFDRFLAHVGPRPSPRHSLDRFPDNDGNYEPGNVRWATSKEQTRNQRSNNRIEWNGKSMILSDWAKELRMTRTTLSYRINTVGWPIEKAFTTPVSTRREIPNERE